MAADGGAPTSPPRRQGASAAAAISQALTAQDADGHTWRLEVQQHQKPHPADRRKLLWEIVLHLRCDTDVASLFACAALDQTTDARLGAMAEPLEPIGFALKPITLQAATQDAVQQLARSEIPRYLQRVTDQSFGAAKRQQLCRLVDNALGFAAS